MNYFQWKQASQDIQNRDIQRKLKESETKTSNIVQQNNRLRIQVSVLLYVLSTTVI